MVGRFLQGLEQHVPTFADALDLVDDEDLAPQVGGCGVDAGQQLAHVVDAVVRCRVHLAHIEGATLADGDTGRADVAGLAVTQVCAVERLG